MYMKLADIQEIQLDHTSRCQLKCSQGARTFGGWSEYPENQNLDLTLEDYKVLLEPFPQGQLRLFHCGNYGDALASPTFDNTFDYSLSRDPKSIMIITNGSLRSSKWWSELAQRGGKKLKVAFSIDGLEDTNHIYREGAIFRKIIENAKAFISEGGRARWDFIEFKHNYHQIELAEEIAHEIGFEEFNVKYTARFASEGNKAVTNNKKQKVEDTDTNKNQSDRVDIIKSYGSFDEYVNKTEISCKTQKRNSVFVDMHMRLWPCCWLGAPLYLKKKSAQTESFIHFLDLYGHDFNSLRVHGWKVLEHEFFNSYLESSWKSPDERFKRIYTCGRTCGEKFEFSSGYGQNRNVKVLRGAEV